LPLTRYHTHSCHDESAERRGRHRKRQSREERRGDVM
jgi:hypothetical protein